MEKTTLAGFLLTMALLLVAGGMTYRATVVSAEAARKVAHTQQVRATLGELYAAVSDAEAQQRNFLLTGTPEYFADYHRHALEADEGGAALARLMVDNPEQTQRLEKLRAVIADRLAVLERTAGTFAESGLAAAQVQIRNGEGLALREQIRGLVTQMDVEEERLLVAREAQSSQDKARTLISLLITLAVAVAGFIALFSGVRREMTTRAQAEEALRQSEESLAVTLYSIGDAVLATDTEGRVTRMNPIAESLTAWTQSDALGKPIGEVFNIINEQTREAAVIPVSQVLTTGKIQGLANHTVLIARDGQERPIADSAAPIRDAEGHILGVVLVFRDVSAEHAAEEALRKSEERYRTLFDSIDEGFCILELIYDAQDHPVDYRFIEINPAFEKQSGLTNAIGRRMREFAPNLEAHWPERFDHIIRTGEAARFQNRAEPQHRMFDVYAFRFGDPAKRQVAAIFSDITQATDAEESVTRLNAELQSRAGELEAANKELESFSYSVSHDLRAPLRHVQGYVGLLTRESEGRLSEKGQRHLKVIADASAEMGQLIDDLLAFSRMGRTEIRLGPVELKNVVEMVISSLEMATKDRRITWKIAPLPRVLGDPAMLRQVLANLIGNAVKYSRQRDPAEIEIGRAGEEKGRVIFFVRDNGAGFNMDYVHKLFGVFQRLHRAEDFEGTGIGLATVQRIIAKHGGRVWAEGKEGHGATFYFTLQLAPAA